jgi:uncharacterized protein (TIGR02145 family)
MNSQNDTLTDGRDGQTYLTVTIGNQIWTAQNMNFKLPGSYCYANKSTNCEEFGRLYTWTAAKDVCPDGWHLPSDEEWQELETFLGMSESELTKSDDWRGTDQGKKLIDDPAVGFNILMGGYRNPPSNYFLMNMQAFFWTSTEQGSQAYFRQFMKGLPQIFRRPRVKNWAMSVRCVKD